MMWTFGTSQLVFEVQDIKVLAGMLEDKMFQMFRDL